MEPDSCPRPKGTADHLRSLLPTRGCLLMVPGGPRLFIESWLCLLEKRLCCYLTLCSVVIIVLFAVLCPSLCLVLRPLWVRLCVVVRARITCLRKAVGTAALGVTQAEGSRRYMFGTFVSRAVWHPTRLYTEPVIKGRSLCAKITIVQGGQVCASRDVQYAPTNNWVGVCRKFVGHN